MQTTYHEGGHDAAKPAQNRAEEWTATGYTRWSKAGAVLEQRALNADESAAITAYTAETAKTTNGQTLRQTAENALTANRNDIATNDTYAAISAPTNAQNLAQIRALTAQSSRQARQLNALIRLVIGKLDGTD